jgi:hypothetical protein
MHHLRLSALGKVWGFLKYYHPAVATGAVNRDSLLVATIPVVRSIRFSGLGVYYPDGTAQQRTGIRIDVEVHPTVEGMRANRDEVLEQAISIALQ